MSETVGGNVMSSRPWGFEFEEIQTDVVVVGGGVAGICAAVAAARSGASVVLVTDRPVLGGNCSSEIRVSMNGAAYSPFNLWSRETGIVEEIRNRHAFLWSGDMESYWTVMDRVYFDMVWGEENLRLLLNTTITDAHRGSGGWIQHVEGVQLRAERRYRIHGRFFIDCSGDGVVGALVGADFRMGREARSEFGEGLAPEVADEGTMGTTLLWASRDVGHPVKFDAPKWALDVSSLDPFANPHDPTRALYRSKTGEFYGFWWAEYGGQLDTIHDDQEILCHTLRLVYGIWNWIKNSGKVNGVENQELSWVATLGGKRESRRLLGPVILTENHWREQTRFEDAIGYTGWPIDIHPPLGYLDPEPGCTHEWLPGPSDIPLRALYSRNVPNLLFAGRNLSATHVGLGSPRVIATTGVMGQAVGKAAAFCLEHECEPAKLDASNIRSIQKRLLSSDQSILGRALDDPQDLARQATVTASSTRRYELLEGATSLPLWNKGGGDSGHNPGAIVFIPVSGHIESISLRFRGNPGQAVAAQVYLADRPENYRAKIHLRDVLANLDINGWARFQLDSSPGEGQKFIFYIPPQSGMELIADSSLIPGVAAAQIWRNPAKSLYDNLFSRDIVTPCFRIEPEQALLEPGNVTDGHIRPYGFPHIWHSERMVEGTPEWLEFSWNEPVKITRVAIVFDSQLNGERAHGVGPVPQLVKDYGITGEQPDRGPVQLVQVRGNFLRFQSHEFDPVEVRRLRLTIWATYGSPYAAVYAVRIYS